MTEMTKPVASQTLNCSCQLIQVAVLDQGGGSQLGEILPHRGHWAMSRHFYLSQLGKGATGIWWVEASGSAKHPTVNRTVPHSYELSSVKYQ